MTASWCGSPLSRWCLRAGPTVAAPPASPIGTKRSAASSTSPSPRATEVKSGLMARPSWLSGVTRLTRHVRLQNAMIVLCTILVSAYGASMYGSLHRSYRQTLDDATGALQSIARSAEVGTNRSIFEIDAMLLGVERMLDTMLPTTPLDDPAVKQLLNQVNDQTLIVRDILIVDHDGRLLNNAGSTATTPTRDVANKPWFAAHQKGGLPSLYLGRPERSRATGGWSIMMSRPLVLNEKTVGVIAAEVPITVFTEFYNSVVANGAARVALLMDDGTLVASEPHREEEIGHRPERYGRCARCRRAAPRRGHRHLGEWRRRPRHRQLRTYPGAPADPHRLARARRHSCPVARRMRQLGGGLRPVRAHRRVPDLDDGARARSPAACLARAARRRGAAEAAKRSAAEHAREHGRGAQRVRSQRSPHGVELAVRRDARSANRFVRRDDLAGHVETAGGARRFRAGRYPIRRLGSGSRPSSATFPMFASA